MKSLKATLDGIKARNTVYGNFEPPRPWDYQTDKLLRVIDKLIEQRDELLKQLVPLWASRFTWDYYAEFANTELTKILNGEGAGE